MNRWDKRFEGEGYAYGTEPNDFLVREASHLPPYGDVLSLAEGEGRNAVYLAAQGHTVTAVDSSAVGLAKAERLAEERGVALTLVVSDVTDFDIGEERWDGIVSIWLHLPKNVRRALYRRCVRGLRPGGVILIEAYRPEQLTYRTGGPPDVDLLVSLDELREDLSGLEFLRAEELVREVSEGALHHGPGAVVQVVARKPQPAG